MDKRELQISQTFNASIHLQIKIYTNLEQNAQTFKQVIFI